MAGRKKPKAEIYTNDRSSNVLSQLDQIPEFKLKKKLEAVRRKINTVLDDLGQDVDKAIDEPHGYTRSYITDMASKLSKKKIFIPRESVLSRLLSDVDFQTVYNMALAILVMFFLGVVVRDHYEKHVVLDMGLVWWSFGKFHLVLMLWSAMTACSFVIIPITEKGRKNRLSRNLLLVIIPALYTAFLAIPAYFVFLLQLPTASSMTLMAEATRILLKMHAYFRERIGSTRFPVGGEYQTIQEIQAAREAERGKEVKQQETEIEGDDQTEGSSTKEGLKNRKQTQKTVTDREIDDDLKGSQASRFAYFLFAPTLLYREVYPRIPRIRWDFVVRRALECAGCILYITVVFQKFVQGVDWGVNSPSFYSWRTIIMSVFNCMLPATLIMILGFFTLLHCWMNLMAELTQFADREFYDDWWNAPGFHAFYRRWNLLVHEWLYYYVYRDLKALGCSSMVAKIGVFTISAILIEIIITLTTRFFLPIVALHFIFMVPIMIHLSHILANASPKGGNLFMWLVFFLQNGIAMVVYSREWYSRMALSTEY